MTQIPEETYRSIAREYSAGVQALFSPETPSGHPERGAALTKSPERLTSQARNLSQVSEALTMAGKNRLGAESADIRSEASTQLLAKALVDLQISAYLLQAAEEQEDELSGSRRSIERGARFAPDVSDALSIIQGETSPSIRGIERKFVPPTQEPAARAQLNQMVTDTLSLIERRAGKTAQSTIGGLITLGIDQIAQASAVVGMDIAEVLGVGDKVSELFALVRQFFQNAYNTLVALLGPVLTKSAIKQVLGWINQAVQGEQFIVLLEKLYETNKTQQELGHVIDDSRVSLERYLAALQGIDSLTTQYSKQAGVIEKIILVLRFLPNIPAAAIPQVKLALTATYILLTSYVVLAGADYIDAPRLQKLDRIPGPRKIILRNLLATAGRPPSQGSSRPADRPAPSAPQMPAPSVPPPQVREAPRPGATGADFPAESVPPPSSGSGVSFGTPSGETGAEAPAGVSENDLIEEKIRLDLAVPKTPVIVAETFEVAVAIRQPGSANLAVDGLDAVTSSDGTLYRRASSELVRYRVTITAPDCDVVTPEYTFLLRSGRDSDPRFFQLVPRHEGTLSIIVTAYQEDNLIAQTRVRVQSTVKAVAAPPPAQDEVRAGLLAELDRLRRAQSSGANNVKNTGIWQYTNLDVELFDYSRDENDRERFKVRVECALVGEQKISDADMVEIPADLRRSLNLLKRRGLQPDEIVALGKQIGQMLFPLNARWYYDQSRARIDEDYEALRIRIKADSYALASIPWEYAYLIPRDAPPAFDGPEGFLVLNRNISLVRYEVMAQPLTSLDPVEDQQLRMVLLLSNSSDPQFPRLNLTQEKKNILKALEDTREIAVNPFSNVTIQTLQDVLDTPAHIFHFAGHGTFQGELGELRGTVVGEGFLVLKGRTPQESLFSARKLALNLKGSGVRLAVLGVCEGGERDTVNAWTGIAPALARADIPAVVAMQFSVYDHSAITFHRSFYRALAAGQPIDTAVTNGRRAIFNLPDADRDWGTPVLYLRAEDGILFPRKDSTTPAGAASFSIPDLQNTASPGIATPAPSSDRQLTLYNALKGYAFSTSDLEELCFLLDVDWGLLEGATKDQKARAMIQFFTKNGTFDRLYQKVKEARPNLGLP